MLFLLSALIFGCQKKNEQEAGKIIIPDGESLELKVGIDGGSKTFEFTSNYDWEVSTEADWIQVTPEKGIAGDAKVTVTVESSLEEREAIVIIDNNQNASFQIKVSQVRFIDPNNYEPFRTELTLEKFENNVFEWQVMMVDSNYYNYASQEGEGYIFKINLDATRSYGNEKGIPVGIYEITDEPTIEAATAVFSKKEGWQFVETPITKGFIEIKRVNDKAEVGFIIYNDKNEKINTYLTIEEDLNGEGNGTLLNRAYLSTISRDMIVNNYTQAAFLNLGDYFRTGKRFWNLIVADDNLNIKFVGPHEGKSEFFSINLITPLDANSPEGTYRFVDDGFEHFDYTVLKGERFYMMPKIGLNSWWISQRSANDNIEDAPMIEGSLEIKKIDDDNYSINFVGVDDAKPEVNTLSLQYSGKTLIYDPTKTGDFATLDALFYGPFEYPSENMNWFIGLGDQEYTDNYGWTGESIVFDVMAPKDAYISKGTPFGTYEIGKHADEYAAGNVVFAEHRIHNGAENPTRTKFVSGKIDLTEIPDGRTKVTIFGVDASGKEYTGEYVGIVRLYNQAMPPYSDMNLGANPIAELRFNGTNYAPENEDPIKNGWDVIIQDENIGKAGQIGMAFTLELRTSEETSIEKGIPSGTYPLYGPENENISKGVRSGAYTFYTVHYEGNSNDRIITGGNLVVDNNGNGEYKFTMNFEMGNDVVNYMITGQYECKPEVIDWSTYYYPANSPRQKSKQMRHNANSTILFTKT